MLNFYSNNNPTNNATPHCKPYQQYQFNSPYRGYQYTNKKKVYQIDDRKFDDCPERFYTTLEHKAEKV